MVGFFLGFRRRVGVFLIWVFRPRFTVLDKVEVETWAMRKRRKAAIKGTEKARGWWSLVLHTSGHGVEEKRDRFLSSGLSEGRERWRGGR